MTDLLSTNDLGQILVIRLETSRWHASFERLLERIHPGGVLLSVPRLSDPASTAGLLARIAHALPVPPFLCLEAEGGDADPLRGIFPAPPSIHTIARCGIDAVERLGELIGSALRLLGFNTNFAPKLDLHAHPSETDKAGRRLPSEAEDMTRSAEAFLRGVQAQGIMSCAGHFPGLRIPRLEGRTAQPFTPEIIGKPMGDLWREDLLPYRRLLNRLAMVLMSPAAYKAYDYDLPQPAARSERVIEGLLRSKLGYSGLAVGDFAEQHGLERSSERDDNVVKTIKAGCDVLVVTEHGHCGEGIHSALERAINAGTLPVARAQQALRRVAEAKKGLSSPADKLQASSFHKLECRFEEFNKKMTRDSQCRAVSA